MNADVTNSGPTCALRDAIAGAPFSDPVARGRVRDLRLTERLVAAGPRGWAASVAFHGLCQTYPVEALRICAELRDGRVIGRAAAERVVRRRSDDQARADARARALQNEREAAAEKAALAVWLALGGEP